LIQPTGVIPNPTNSDLDPNFPRTYRITFPRQTLSGTYSIVLASSVRSKNGDALDTNQNAGLEVLRGQSPSGQSIPVQVPSTDQFPIQLAEASNNKPGVTVSTLNVTDNFVLQSLTLQLNITHPNDPDLSAVLIAPDGTRVTLFSNIGANGTRANFINTV